MDILELFEFVKLEDLAMLHEEDNRVFQNGKEIQ